MQEDFHYYATYCAAHLAGHSPRESREISYCAQLVDLCSKTFLTVLNAPRAAATTQLQLELMEARTDLVGLQDITRIWSSFHFLPRTTSMRTPAGEASGTSTSTSSFAAPTGSSSQIRWSLRGGMACRPSALRCTSLPIRGRTSTLPVRPRS